MEIILGSQSVFRKSVLEKAGYKFTVMPADIDEKAIRSDNYEELPLLIARAKASALLERITDPVLLITSDQVVVCNGGLREKPESSEEARKFLESYAKYPAQTNTAVVVTNTENGKSAEGIDLAMVYFKPFPEQVIDELVKTGATMNSAGGFVTEHPLISPYIDHIDGEDNSVIGLPMVLTQRLLKEVQE